MLNQTPRKSALYSNWIFLLWFNLLPSCPTLIWRTDPTPFFQVIYTSEDCHYFSLQSYFLDHPVAFKPCSQVIISVLLFLDFSSILWYTLWLGWDKGLGRGRQEKVRGWLFSGYNPRVQASPGKKAQHGNPRSFTEKRI